MRLGLAAFMLVSILQDKPAVGKICPDIALKTLEGKEIKLSDFRKKDGADGNIVLIVFWSYKCPDGKAILPRLAAKCEELDKAGIKLVNICSYGEPEDKIKDFVQKNEIKYTMCYDDGLAAAKALGVKVATASIVCDPEGKVVYIGGIFPEQTDETYDGIQAALDLKAGKPPAKSEVKPKG